MDEYEKRIREKVYEANILSSGEWVYLVGLFQTAKEHDECVAENETLRKRVAELKATYIDLATD